jgi:hypothetical protein
LDRGGWGQRGGAHPILRRERNEILGRERARQGETRRGKARQGEKWREYQVRTRVG